MSKEGRTASGSAVIEHRAHFAEHIAHDKVVAGAERAVLHEYRRDRSAAAIEFASSTTPVAARSGFAFNSARSATRQIISISRLRLVFFFAETSTKTFAAPLFQQYDVVRRYT